MMSISLPWPPKELSPNARVDRRAATSRRRAYRDAGFWLAHKASLPIEAGSRLVLTFHPPDNRRRDLDNMLASIKSGLDGIAQASGCDDSGWSLTLERGEPVKGGAVIVRVADPWRSIGEIARGMVKGTVNA